MSRKRWSQVLFFAAVLSTTGAAWAAEPYVGADSDQAFLKRALGVNEVELQLGHLASEYGASAEVKAMGAKMIDKHTQLGGQLRELAKEAGTSGDAELSQDQRETVARVESRSGADFDTTFKRTVDDGHVKELAMYREESARASSPRLRALAEQRVATLQAGMANASGSKTGQQ
jgi:predicted outer membrane protein